MPIALYETIQRKLKLVAVSMREVMESPSQTVGLISERKYRQLLRQGIREVREEDVRIRPDTWGDPLLEQFA